MTNAFHQRAVFLDRDGTVVKDVWRKECSWPTGPWTFAELRFMPEAREFTRSLKELGFLRIMVTNQPDIAYGKISRPMWEKIQRKIVNTLGFDDVFMCRHPRDSGCCFRKPSPLMLFAAAEKWGINLAASYFIGNSFSDIYAGKAAGCQTIILDANYNRDTQSDFRVTTLSGALLLIKNLTKNQNSR